MSEASLPGFCYRFRLGKFLL